MSCYVLNLIGNEVKNPIEVITMNMVDHTEYDRRTIDHDNDSDRRWLGNHTYWAVRNGHGVQIAPHTN